MLRIAMVFILVLFCSTARAHEPTKKDLDFTGMTNQDVFDTYGLKLIGGLAPCKETRPEVAVGFVCPLEE